MRTAIAITAISAISLTAACGSNDRSTPVASTPAAATAPTATPSPSYDESTLRACREADQTGEKNDPDFKHAVAARRNAELSGVPTLRDVADKYPDDTSADKTGKDLQALTAAVAISTWCLQHHIE